MDISKIKSLFFKNYQQKISFFFCERLIANYSITSLCVSEVALSLTSVIK